MNNYFHIFIHQTHELLFAYTILEPSLLLSVLYIFVTSLSDVLELFHIGSLDMGTNLLCVSSCQMQICANCPQVL